VFFFQAEDGIRDDLVTGVQTCALPIYTHRKLSLVVLDEYPDEPLERAVDDPVNHDRPMLVSILSRVVELEPLWELKVELYRGTRSEERRVGKEGSGRRRANSEGKEERR